MNIFSLETMKVQHPTAGWVVINKSDFDPAVHVLFEEAREEKELETPPTGETTSEPPKPHTRRKKVEPEP